MAKHRRWAETMVEENWTLIWEPPVRKRSEIPAVRSLGCRRSARSFCKGPLGEVKVPSEGGLHLGFRAVGKLAGKTGDHGSGAASRSPNPSGSAHECTVEFENSVRAPPARSRWAARGARLTMRRRARWTPTALEGGALEGGVKALILHEFAAFGLIRAAETQTADRKQNPQVGKLGARQMEVSRNFS